jgi:hypothetical protein
MAERELHNISLGFIYLLNDGSINPMRALLNVVDHVVAVASHPHPTYVDVMRKGHCLTAGQSLQCFHRRFSDEYNR